MTDQLVKELVGRDGHDRVQIWRTPHGLLYYVDEYLRTYEGDEDYGAYARSVSMWCEQARSGFYASVADAERDARAAVAWLRSPG